VLVAAVGVLTAPAGAVAVLTPGDHRNESFVFDGVERLYDVHVPPSYDGSTPVPLVLDFHGFAVNKTWQAAYSGMKERADASGFIAVYPQALFGLPDDPEGENRPDGPSWNAGNCCGKAVATGVDDVGFIRTLVERLALEDKIDRTRVYATGLSNGGGMSHRLACEAADMLAAAAPLASPIPFPYTRCQPSRPISVINFLGLTDTVVPYNGRPGVHSAAESFSAWRTIDGCGTGPVEETVVTGTSRCETDTSCAAGVQNALCSINADAAGLGHVLYQNPDLVIADVAWEFLSQFALPEPLPPLPTRVSGSKLMVKDSGTPSKRKFLLLLKDPALGNGIDPTADGAALQVYNSNGSGESVCLSLPADGWRAASSGFVYKDGESASGPCKSAKVKQGKLLKVVCQGISYSLDEEEQGSLAVRFSSGSRTYCAGFGGTVAEDEAGIFTAFDAPSPSLCPAPREPCP
jgi:polyhydroxybutyrate depolymerase